MTTEQSTMQSMTFTEQHMHTEQIAFFDKPPINKAILKTQYVNHEADYTTSKGHEVVAFHVESSNTQLIDFSRSYFQCSIQIEKVKDDTDFKIHKLTDNDGNTIGDDNQNIKNEYGIPVDNIFHSLWKGVDIIADNKTISTSGTNYMYKAFIEQTLGKTTEEKMELGHLEGYSPDEGDFTATHPYSLNLNKGLQDRYSWTKDKKKFTMKGPLKTDIWQQDKLMLNGVNLSFILTPTNDEFRLITNPEGLKCKITLSDLQLYLCKVTLDPRALIGVSHMLKKVNAKYPITKTDVRMKQVDQGSFSLIIDNIYKDKSIPTRVICGLVDAHAYNGHMNKNPFYFENCAITSAGFYIDDEPVPHKPYTLNFQDDMFLDALMTLHKMYSPDDRTLSPIGIDRETFKNGLTLIAFEVDPSAPTNLNHYWPIAKTGICKLEFYFKNAIPKAMNLMIYSTFPGMVEINEVREVLPTKLSGGSAALGG